jgi:hypothetical protein
MAVEMPHADLFGKAILGELGEVTTTEVVQESRNRYRELLDGRHLYANRALRNHLERNILPGIALYQTLKSGEGTEGQALQLAELAFHEWGMASRQTMTRVGRLPFFYWLLRVTAKPMMRRNFPEEGWEIKWVEISSEQTSFNMRSCFYLQVLEDYGVPELAPLYCSVDDAIYEGVSPYVKWARKRTLARGDEYCDFRFVRLRPEQ